MKRTNATQSYPELRAIAEKIADDTCKQITELARQVESEMPYKTLFILEAVAMNLARRV